MIKVRFLRKLNERLDRIGRELIRASSVTAEEADVAASSPWLFARLRARIASERERRETSERWSILITVIRHAIPATGLATAAALALFIVASSGAPQPATQFSDQALFETSDAGVQHVVFAERRPLSPDEVLDTIITGEREVSR
jgi:hypothetical protein